MGLFDLFRKKDSAEGADRDLLRLKKLVSNKLSQNIDRQEALERLAGMGTGQAAEVLLTRFSWNLDPSITDQEEKNLAVEGIAYAGEAALEPIRVYCARSESIVWPIKALRRIVESERLGQELLLLLDEFDTDYVRNPEPKIQLLQALEDYPSEDTRIAVEPFLSDASEGVRFAAVTTVFACENDAAAESLCAALVEDESLRVKNRIAAGLVERAWTVPDALLETLPGALPPGFRLELGKVIGTPAR